MDRRNGTEGIIGTRKARSGCRRFLGSLTIIIVFAVLFLVAAGVFLHKALTSTFKGYGDPSVLVEVRKGANSRTILRELHQKGVLRDDFVPLLFLKTLRRGDSLKAGVYEFDRPMTAVAVLDKLIDGDVVFRSITIREGLDRFAVASIMAEGGFGTVEEWLELTSDTELIRDLDGRAESLEGYLFPDTYKLAPGTPARAVVKTMVDNFRRQFGDELAFIATGLDLHDTVTLASIVETEAQRPEERPIVGSVYMNRVRLGMPLQADPTVIYAMKLRGTWKGNIRRADLQMDSPYNTYRVKGFPPGPIASPGLASLRAAANPATTTFLYFVSRNDGSHVFANTLAEHNRNVNLHQRKFWRDKRAAAANGN